MIGPDTPLSEMLENFIETTISLSENSRIAHANLTEAVQQLQDVEHYAEIMSYDAIKGSQLIKKLRDCRKKRREAKDAIFVSEPLLNWVEKNQKIIQQLTEVLGEIRKREDKLRTRTYAVRTTILSDISEKTHLSATK